MKKSVLFGICGAFLAFALILIGCPTEADDSKPPVTSDYQGTYSKTLGVYESLTLDSGSATTDNGVKMSNVSTSGGGDLKAGISVGRWDYVFVNNEKYGVVYRVSVAVTGNNAGTFLHLGKASATAANVFLKGLEAEANISDIGAGVPEFTGQKQ